jgi:predicted metallo-beta-lactamase superfamily hydrolase
VNFSQRHRGWIFANTGGKYTERFEFADGKEFVFGETQVSFSQPVIHGEQDSELGWLIMTTIKRDNERVLFTSDVQGPMHAPTLKVMLDEKPEVAIVGGPPAYLSGLVPEESIKLGLQNLEQIVKNVPATILEHHLLRQENWRELARSIFEAAKDTQHSVHTAAEFLKKEDILLESRRKLLYETEPPSNEFKKWTRMPIEKRKKTPPPI